MKSVGWSVPDLSHTTHTYFVTDKELRTMMGLGPRDVIAKCERAVSKLRKGFLDHGGMLFTIIKLEGDNNVPSNRT